MKRNQIITQAFRLCKRQSTSVLKAPAVALKPAQQRSFVKIQNVKTSAASVSNKRFYADKTVVVPGMGDSITEGTIQAWLKKENEGVEEDEVICQIETDKVTADVRSPGKGVLKQLMAKKGETVSVGQNLFVIDIGATASASAAPQQSVEKAEKPKAEAPKPAPQQPAPQQAAPQPAAPKAEAPKPAAEAPKPAPSAPQQPAASAAGAPSRNETRVQMTRMRKTIASRLKDSQNTYAMLTTFNEIDMSKLTDLRNKYKDAFAEKHGIKLGFMSAFVKASATALSEMPVVNAVIEGDDIIYRDFVDISVAVATPKGLVVPVLRNCESKNFADIEKDIFNFGEKAKKNQLTIPEMQGGTFTISNGGVFGSLMGTPIINPPQSAILGMHGIQKRPVVVNDQIVIRPMMYVALTYDHRLIDGREAVTFLRRVKELVEEPEKFLI